MGRKSLNPDDRKKTIQVGVVAWHIEAVGGEENAKRICSESVAKEAKKIKKKK